MSQSRAAPDTRARRRVGITRKQYAVHTVRDEPVRLRDQLDHIAAEGGRVVSVIWQPARQVTLEPGLPPYEVASGYVVVSEHELSDEAAGHRESLCSEHTEMDYLRHVQRRKLMA